jgi:hypothetical protein
MSPSYFFGRLLCCHLDIWFFINAIVIAATRLVKVTAFFGFGSTGRKLPKSCSFDSAATWVDLIVRIYFFESEILFGTRITQHRGSHTYYAQVCDRGNQKAGRGTGTSYTFPASGWTSASIEPDHSRRQLRVGMGLTCAVIR